jgi:hypothetical protein
VVDIHCEGKGTEGLVVSAEQSWHCLGHSSWSSHTEWIGILCKAIVAAYMATDALFVLLSLHSSLGCCWPFPSSQHQWRTQQGGQNVQRCHRSKPLNALTNELQWSELFAPFHAKYSDRVGSGQDDNRMHQCSAGGSREQQPAMG